MPADRRHLTPEASRRIADLYRGGRSVTDICGIVGVTARTVYLHLDRHGIDRPRNTRRRTSAQQRDRLARLMLLLSRPGPVPSHREMQRHLRTSSHGVQCALSELEALGYIRVDRNTPRAIAVLVSFVAASDVRFVSNRRLAAA